MKTLNVIMVVLGILGLIGVRVVEDRFFYDPFIQYFHEAYQQLNFPEFNLNGLVISHIVRFLLNLIFSAIIIQFIFNNKKWTVYAAIVMTIVFAIAFPVYLYCIHTKFEVGYLFSFYVRRFVIQPIILLLIIPMFYYLKHNPEEIR